MPEVFFSIKGNMRAVVSQRLGSNGLPQSLNAAIPDGDTIGVHMQGSGGVRFLGIDTAEKNFELPGSPGARRLDSAEWEAYLTNPFQAQFGPLSLEPDLSAHLQARVGAGAGINHRFHGERSEQALIDLVQSDMNALGQNLNNFKYFISFSFEVFDTYGRFLAFINRDQPDANVPGQRPPSYNQRMLEQGASLPYFIWPNIDPFREVPLLSAVIAPGSANQVAQNARELNRARVAVQQARSSGLGVFDPANPLRFEAFEIRYLGRREAPNRAIIDLSNSDDVLLRPQSYYKIPNPEDRLFIPPAFVPLFLSRGWKPEGWF